MLDGASAQQSSLSLGHLSRPQVFGGDILGLQTLSTGSQQFLHRDPPRCPGLPHVLLVHTPDSLGFLAFAPGKLTPRTQSGQ